MKEIRDKSSSYLQKHTQFMEEFIKVQSNAYTGLGSDFLKGEKQDIFAGKLHLKAQQKTRKIGGQKKMPKPN
jgi:hypothetical protein